MRSSPAAALAAALAITLGSAPSILPAQAPPAWTRFPVPGGVNPANLVGLGKLVHYTETGMLNVYSAFTRTWRRLPVTSAATVRRTNDLLLIQDGTTWTAFGASRGRFDAITVTSGAVVVNPASQNNDSVLLVLDGSRLSAFSGFTGRWTHRIVTANAALAVERHVALLADGALLSGYDSYTGQWHDTTAAAAPSLLSASGVAGIAVAGATVHGFSGLRGTWTTAPAIQGARFDRGHDWAVLHDQTQALGYSGLTGSFAGTTWSGPATAVTEDLYGLFVTATAVDGFSAFTGTWRREPMAPGAVLHTSSGVALFLEAARVVAWSAPLGSFTALPMTAVADGVAGVVAAAQDTATNALRLFSALTGQWVAAPAAAQQTLPFLAGTAALLPTTSGFAAFSARSGAFVPLATANGFAATDRNSAPALVWDDTHVHCFDARRDVWQSIARTGSGAPTVSIWRTGALVVDGLDAIAFATQSGNLERTQLASAPLGYRANSESVGVSTQNELLAFSSLPLPTGLVQFPDFRRAFVAGATFRLQLRLLPGDLGLLAAGTLAPSPLAVPGLGEFLLDPNAHVATFVAPATDADRGDVAVATPASAALRGASFWFQALVVPASGLPYLTEGSELRVF